MKKTLIVIFAFISITLSVAATSWTVSPDWFDVEWTVVYQGSTPTEAQGWRSSNPYAICQYRWNGTYFYNIATSEGGPCPDYVQDI